MLATSPFNKERRRKSLERKNRERRNRRNPIAEDLRTSKYRKRIVEDLSEKKGANNLLKHLIYEEV